VCVCVCLEGASDSVIGVLTDIEMRSTVLPISLFVFEITGGTTI